MAPKDYSIVALIPARAGSKRVPDKNIRPLAGHPVIAYTIAAALDSGVFTDVIVSTDSEHYAEIVKYYGAQVPFLRPAELAGDQSPDIEWLEFTLGRLCDTDRKYDGFSILRPTSPFRLPQTIQRAWQEFLGLHGVDSLRAPEIYVQNASLEIAWSRVVFEDRTIAGNVVMPFFTTDHEGFDVNNEYDWQLAEQMVQKGEAKLPQVLQPPYS
jgi:CMP-N,N'-diacetyllegionaminic acid synthase